MNDALICLFCFSPEISFIRSRVVASWASHFWPPATSWDSRRYSGDSLSLSPAASWRQASHQELLGRGSLVFSALTTTASRSQAWAISSCPLSLGYGTASVEKFQSRYEIFSIFSVTFCYGIRNTVTVLRHGQKHFTFF